MKSDETGKHAGARRSSRLLALIPVATAVLLGALVFPRAVPPSDIPLPVVDAQALARTEAQDRRVIDEARKRSLPDDVRVLGSAIRAFNTAQSHDELEAGMVSARRALDEAFVVARTGNGVEPLLALRALSLDGFLSEVAHYQRSGEVTAELTELGGNFLRRMRAAGWATDRSIALGEAELRVAFKITWNALLGLEKEPTFALTIDEQRALYAFYLTHPHAPDGSRTAFASARKAARDTKACDALRAGEDLAAEGWRLDKIRRLGAIDADYPLAFAVGVAEFRRGEYLASAVAFREWLEQHPDGKWSLRAKNHLRAAQAATESP